MKEKKNWHTYASDAKLLSVVVDDSSSSVSGGDFPHWRTRVVPVLDVTAAAELVHSTVKYEDNGPCIMTSWEIPESQALLFLKKKKKFGLCSLYKNEFYK